MGLVLHFTARRSTPLRPAERAELEQRARQASDALPAAGEPMMFDLGILDVERPDVVAEGSARLPMDLADLQSAVGAWCGALTTVRRSLPDAVWTVTLGGMPLEWTEVGGYTLTGLVDGGADAGARPAAEES